MSLVSIKIQFDEQTATYHPGELVTGAVLVDVHQDCSCENIELKREWRTHGKGNRTSGGSAYSSLAKSSQWKKGQVYQYPFRFEADSGPPTYHGHYLNVDWYLTATAKISWGIARLKAGHVRHPKSEKEFVIRRTRHPLTIRRQKKPTGARRRIDVGAGAAMALLIAAFLILSAVKSENPIWAAVIAIMLVIFGVSILRPIVGNLFWRLINGPVSVQINPGADGNTLLGQIRFQPKRSVALTHAAMTLIVREEVVEGSGSNRETYKRGIFSKRDHNYSPGTATANRWFENVFSLEFPDTLPPAFDEKDNKIIWTAKFELETGGWQCWQREIEIEVTG